MDSGGKEKDGTAIAICIVLALALLFVGNSLYDKSRDLKTVCSLRPDPGVVADNPKTAEESANAICAEALGLGGQSSTGADERNP